VPTQLELFKGPLAPARGRTNAERLENTARILCDELHSLARVGGRFKEIHFSSISHLVVGVEEALAALSLERRGEGSDDDGDH